MWILGGTIVLRGDTDRRVANSSLLIDAAGKRVARYDKIHLFDVTIPGVVVAAAASRVAKIADEPNPAASRAPVATSRCIVWLACMESLSMA